MASMTSWEPAAQPTMPLNEVMSSMAHCLNRGT